ncbi:MAG: beta-glucosidase [Bacteroidota bacterium]
MLAGFGSGSYRPRRGARVDLAVLTGHDRFATLDYARARALGIGTVRESARWPVVEQRAWRYDFGVLLPWVRAARRLDIDVVWTLLDGCWPEDIAPMEPALVRRLEMFARAFARFLREETDRAPVIVPVDQITARAWLGGELARAEPYLEERGFELQAQLVRAAIAAADAFRDVTPEARILCVEPLFHVAPSPDRPEDLDGARAAAARRFAALDMLCGRAWPQLGGEPRHLDLLGVTVYPHSQWYYGGPKFPGPPIEPDAPAWRPLRELIVDLACRYYDRPVAIVGTGRDGPLGPSWLRYVCREARGAMFAGATVPCVGLAPAVACTAQPDERGACEGIWGDADEAGRRTTNLALAEEIAMQRACFDRFDTSLQAARAAAALPETAAPAAAVALHRAPG